MNLYKLTQTVNNNSNTYDSAIVIAESEKEAMAIHPRQIPGSVDFTWDSDCSWAYEPSEVKAEFIGIFQGEINANQNRVLCASFNAG